MTETTYPASRSARASLQTRLSRGTGRFSTMMQTAVALSLVCMCRLDCLPEEFIFNHFCVSTPPNPSGAVNLFRRAGPRLAQIEPEVILQQSFQSLLFPQPLASVVLRSTPETSARRVPAQLRFLRRENHLA